MYKGAMLHLQLWPTANFCPCSQESKHEKPQDIKVWTKKRINGIQPLLGDILNTV
jgi:hypothetical protein